MRRKGITDGQGERTSARNTATAAEALSTLAGYFPFYNHELPHQALEYQTSVQVYGVA